MKLGKIFRGFKAVWPAVCSPNEWETPTRFFPLPVWLPAIPPWGAHTHNELTVDLFFKGRR